MSKPAIDPSGPAKPVHLRLPPRYLERVPELAAKWGCTKAEALQRLVCEGIDREVPEPSDRPRSIVALVERWQGIVKAHSETPEE